jgi:hypothetical protein
MPEALTTADDTATAVMPVSRTCGRFSKVIPAIATLGIGISLAA